MRTKSADYTISELGYPQWQPQCAQKEQQQQQQWSNVSNCCSASPSRLLPLRETLDDYYYKRLLSEQRQRQLSNSRVKATTAAAASAAAADVALRKQQKNQWNERLRCKNAKCLRTTTATNGNNQKCAPKSRDAASTATATALTSDLNCF